MYSKLRWIIIILGTLVMVVVMSITGKPLKTYATPHGIVDLELSGSEGAVISVLLAWTIESFPYKPGMPLSRAELIKRGTPPIITAAKINTYLDFIFIVFYTSLFVACCRTLSQRLSQHRFIPSLGYFMAKAAIAAALLDVIENIGMLLSLSGNISDPIALMTMIASSIKWLIVFCTILYIIVAFIYWKTRKQAFSYILNS